MKKTLLTPLAFAVAGVLAAGSAHAVNIYKSDDAYVNLTGEVAFEAIRDIDDGDQFESKTDNVDLEITAGYILENGADVYGFYAHEFASETGGNAAGKDTLKDHYLGVKYKGWHAKYGDLDYAVDDYGLRKNLDAKTAMERVINPDDSERDQSSNVIYISYKGDGYFVSASHDTTLDNSTTSEETGFDLFAKAKVTDGLWLGGVYSKQDYYKTGGNEYDAYGVQAEYTGIKDLMLGINWFFGENFNQKEVIDNAANGYDITAKYKVSKKISVAGGFGVASPDTDNVVYEEDMTTWYLNANYNIRKNLDVYGEVYDEDTGTNDDRQLGFVFGVSLDF